MKVTMLLLSVMAMALVTQARPIGEEVEEGGDQTHKQNLHAPTERMTSALLDGQDEIIEAGGDTNAVAAAIWRIEEKQKAAAEISQLQKTRKQELANPVTRELVDNEAVDREVNLRRQKAPISRFGEDNDVDFDWDSVLGTSTTTTDDQGAESEGEMEGKEEEEKKGEEKEE